MIAPAHYELTQVDLAVVLALVRGGTLKAAGELAGVNTSTVFRVVQRLERALGQRLFERSRSGYRATDGARQLASHAEAIETEVARARGTFGAGSGAARSLAGTVRIGAIDAILHAFVVPAVAALRAEHPKLHFELIASNELASLTHRDVDIALRSTNRPPPHLLGRRLGTVRFAVYGAHALAGAKGNKGKASVALDALAQQPWVAIDDAMPDHPGVAWRKRTLPMVRPVVRANSMLTLAQLVEQGFGVGVLALFHAQRYAGLVQLTAPLEGCQVELWLLSHPESRHLPRIAQTAAKIAASVPAGFER